MSTRTSYQASAFALATLAWVLWGRLGAVLVFPESFRVYGGVLSALRVKVAFGFVPLAVPLLWLTGALHTLPGPKGLVFLLRTPAFHTRTLR